MTTILHPTRGGQSSYANQDRVVALAKELEANLVFLYVSDVKFLSSVASPTHVEIVQDELRHMGEFLLAMAQERASSAGWQADAVVLRGNFHNAVAETIQERGVDILILGAPEDEQAVTTRKFLKEMMEKFRTEFNVRVMLIRNGEIIEDEAAGGEES